MTKCSLVWMWGVPSASVNCDVKSEVWLRSSSNATSKPFCVISKQWPVAVLAHVQHTQVFCRSEQSAKTQACNKPHGHALILKMAVHTLTQFCQSAQSAEPKRAAGLMHSLTPRVPKMVSTLSWSSSGRTRQS